MLLADNLAAVVFSLYSLQELCFTVKRGQPIFGAQYEKLSPWSFYIQKGLIGSTLLVICSNINIGQYSNTKIRQVSFFVTLCSSQWDLLADCAFPLSTKPHAVVHILAHEAELH